MVLRSAVLTAQAALAAPSLEEIGLRKVVQRLVGVLALASTKLRENLEVKVLVYILRSMLAVGVGGSRHKLLKLNTGNEVFVLGRHQAVIA